MVDVAQGGGKHCRSEADLKGKKELVSKNHGKSFTKKRGDEFFCSPFIEGFFRFILIFWLFLIMVLVTYVPTKNPTLMTFFQRGDRDGPGDQSSQKPGDTLW